MKKLNHQTTNKMSNIKITIEGVEKEYRALNSNEFTYLNDIFLFGKWYREVEPVKQDYEIISFKAQNGGLWENQGGIFKANNFLDSYSLNEMLIHVKQENATIKSVKRLTDGEVFSVGEVVKHIKRDDTWKVEKIEIDGCTIRISAGYYYVILKYAVKVKQPTILLTTEDGKVITDGEQMLFAIDEEFNNVNQQFAKKLYRGLKYFSTSEARDEYILQNKPITVTLKEYLECHNNVHDFFKSKQK